MLKLSHISKTFNPGTVNEKVAIQDLSFILKKVILQPSSVPTEPASLPCLMPSAGIFSQIPVLSCWMDRTLRLCPSMSEQEHWAPLPGSYERNSAGHDH